MEEENKFEFTEEIIDLYEKIFEEIFVDLKDIDEIDKSAFLSLFVGRNNQRTEILPIIRNFKENKHRKKNNILIKGAAGIGKTTLMLRIIKEKNLFDDSLKYIFLDFNNISGIRNDKGFLLELIKKMNDFFDETKYPINTFDDINNTEKLTANYAYLIEHLNLIEKKDFNKKLVLIVDDLDYADHYWKDILDQIIKFSDFKNILLILNARPPLVNDIMNTNDRFRIKFTREVKTIELTPIEILNLITSRISIFLNNKEDDEEDNIFSRVAKLIPFYNTKNPIESIIKKTDICSGDDLLQIKGKLDLYFTEEDIQFISNITNGNIREVFFITQTLLLYILKNIKHLEKHHTHGIIIPRLDLINLFKDTSKPFYFINIFEKTQDIFSLLKHFERKDCITDSDIINILKKTKMKAKDIEITLDEMLSTRNRLICPVNTNIFSNNHEKCFKITEKGKYYLNELSYIQEYMDYTNDK